MLYGLALDTHVALAVSVRVWGAYVAPMNLESSPAVGGGSSAPPDANIRGRQFAAILGHPEEPQV